ncbi:MAG: hypothetical protein M3Y59_06695 [Myxococcota bacterium]|nr:hypothetical protein [Myxococcota bacterium]
MPDNRISSLTVAETGSRQTPRSEFGEVFARTGSEVVRTGVGLAGVLGSVVTGTPVVTAAVNSLQGLFAQSSSPSARSTTTLPGGDSAGGGAAAGIGGGDAMEMLQAQSAMQAEGFKLNSVYLGMQREMQRESREFSALSNIMKVRHDTAKSAINNVR